MQGAYPLRRPIGSGPQTKQRACPMRLLSVKKQGEVPFALQGGSGGIPRPFEGGIGGPGGHRGEVGIPPAPLAGGATLQKENHLALSRKFFLFRRGRDPGKKAISHHPKIIFPLPAEPRSQKKLIFPQTEPFPRQRSHAPLPPTNPFFSGFFSKKPKTTAVEAFPPPRLFLYITLMQNSSHTGAQ